jgi:branched-chain amino acid transport system substrate-binding protein
MNMKLKAMTVVVGAAVTMGFSAPASAQISGDVIKIGLVTDLSGSSADMDGPNGAEAVRMAIADFGGMINGKKIEFLLADHQNKADIAAGRAREWIDRNGLDMLIGGANSSTNLAMAKVTADKKIPYFAVGGATARLTNEECQPYTIHYAFDTVALARGTGSAIVQQGGKSWYFLTADYAFGASLEKDTAAVVKENNGVVVGHIKHPLFASDFSSFLMQAQASKAQILGLANSGGDTINSIKAAREFGITKTMKLAGLMIFITDIHSLGLEATQGLYLTTGWYWDQSDESRAWANKFLAKTKKRPSMLQAADYSATMHYLNAVKALGTDDPDKVMARMRATKVNDFFAKNGVIRPDGRMVHDMYLMEVKTPAESKYPWDYYKLVRTIPGEQAFTTKAESKCALWK